MALFKTKERTRTAPMRPGETEYSFYNLSARPEHQVYRDLINSWIAEFPPAARDELIARFRKNRSPGYQAALAELVIHTALIRQGLSVEVHPSCTHSTKTPDFLVRTSDGDILTYIEVTSFGPTDEDVARSNREAAIYNELDKSELPPGFRLGFDVVRYGTTNPSLKDLRSAVENWAGACASDDLTNVPARVFEAADWKIEISLFGGSNPESVSERAIVAAMNVRWVSAETSIRHALEEKGSRYGALNAPYLIVVADCNAELSGGESIDEALLEAAFGIVVDEITTAPSGERDMNRKRCRDGYFGYPGLPKHRNVSAVILLPSPHLWELRDTRCQPLLLLNPWAEHRHPSTILPLRRYQYTEEDGFTALAGTMLADILGLPKVWPPEKMKDRG